MQVGQFPAPAQVDGEPVQQSQEAIWRQKKDLEMKREWDRIERRDRDTARIMSGCYFPGERL